ncbi:glycosyltransferase family 4 protein [Thermostilla marina]
MRIVYLFQYFATPEMTGSTFAYETARRLVARGHEVHVVTSDFNRNDGRWRTSECEGITIHWCGIRYSNHLSYRRRMVSFFRFAAKSARRAAALGGHVVYASSTPLTIALPGVYASRRNAIPMVFEVRDLWPDTPIAVGALRGRMPIAAARRLELFAYRNAARIIARSPDMARGIVSTGYPADRVTVIPNACDFALFDVPSERGKLFRARYEWLGERPLVVYTGTLGLVNGVSYLARVAAEMSSIDPDVRFLIVGGGREETLVRDTARGLGVLDKNFFMMPPLPKREVPDVLSAADLATSTVIDRRALWANSANKVFDAMAAGKAFAINHEGWLADLIRQHDCGLVLPAVDHRAAAVRLATALRDRQWLRGAAQRAKELGKREFDRDRLVDRLEGVLHAAVARSDGVTRRRAA